MEFEHDSGFYESLTFCGEVSPVHAMKENRESRGIVSLIRILRTRWELVVNFTPRPLYCRERRPVPFNIRLGGPRIRPGHIIDQKNLLPLKAFKPPAVMPIT